MISYVYIIRPKNNMNKFFILDPDTGNWDWTTNLEDATMFQTANSAESVITQKLAGEDAYVYEIPYSVAQPQSRKKKKIKPKTKIHKKKIKRSKK